MEAELVRRIFLLAGPECKHGPGRRSTTVTMEKTQKCNFTDLRLKSNELGFTESLLNDESS